MSTLPVFALSPVSRTLSVDPPLTDQELEDLCFHNHVAFERRMDGLLIMNPPTGLLTGDANAEITRQLRNWLADVPYPNYRGRVTDSSTGFFLPDGAMLSPDAAYITEEQLAGLTEDDLSHIPHLCPAFILELRSLSDKLPDLESKMGQWLANGAQLGWLIDPYQQQVTVYRTGGQSVYLDVFTGTGPVAGFVLNLTNVWRCFKV